MDYAKLEEILQLLVKTIPAGKLEFDGYIISWDFDGKVEYKRGVNHAADTNY